MHPADFRVIEGAGGWQVPVNDRESMSLLPKQLELDVVLVVGMKLGCLNHALLTAQSIRMSGVKMIAWVATQVDPEMYNVEENLDTLKRLLGAPCLGFIPYEKGISAERASEYIELPIKKD